MIVSIAAKRRCEWTVWEHGRTRVERALPAQKLLVPGDDFMTLEQPE